MSSQSSATAFLLVVLLLLLQRLTLRRRKHPQPDPRAAPLGAHSLPAVMQSSSMRMGALSAFGFGALVANMTELLRPLEKPSLAALPFFLGP
jgi:hypothetical protein